MSAYKNKYLTARNVDALQKKEIYKLCLCVIKRMLLMVVNKRNQWLTCMPHGIRMEEIIVVPAVFAVSCQSSFEYIDLLLFKSTFLSHACSVC